MKKMVFIFRSIEGYKVMVYKKSKFEKILIFFAALYPIIPAYFKIVGFSFPNLCCITFILLSALYRKIRFIIKKNVVVFLYYYGW